MDISAVLALEIGVSWVEMLLGLAFFEASNKFLFWTKVVGLWRIWWRGFDFLEKNMEFVVRNWIVKSDLRPKEPDFWGVFFDEVWIGGNKKRQTLKTRVVLRVRTIDCRNWKPEVYLGIWNEVFRALIGFEPLRLSRGKKKELKTKKRQKGRIFFRPRYELPWKQTNST